jgi:hypothetical protein
MSVTDRLLEVSDEPMLAASLEQSEAHKGTTVDFFKQDGVMSRVYEDEQGPICFARCSKSLRLDVHFVDDANRKRNAKVLAAGIEGVAAAAKSAGYNELVFSTSNPELAGFCEHMFGYEVVPDKFVLRKQI